MTITEIITIIVSSILGSSALFVAVAWFARSLIKHYLGRDLERYKSDLERVSFERQIRFSKLHETRAQIIAEFYSRLHDFQWAVSAFLRDFHKKDNAGQSDNGLDDKLYNVTDFFDKHRIYFTDDICLKVDELVKALLHAYVPLEGRAPDEDNIKRDWDMCAKYIKQKYPAIKESLEADFRNILGVTEN